MQGAGVWQEMTRSVSAKRLSIEHPSVGSEHSAMRVSPFEEGAVMSLESWSKRHTLRAAVQDPCVGLIAFDRGFVPHRRVLLFRCSCSAPALRDDPPLPLQ